MHAALPLVALVRLGFGGAPTPVRPLAEPEAFRALVQGTQASGRAAVVQFSSTRCKACASIQPRLERLAAGWPELDFYKLTYEEADGANRKRPLDQPKPKASAPAKAPAEAEAKASKVSRRPPLQRLPYAAMSRALLFTRSACALAAQAERGRRAIGPGGCEEDDALA